MNGLKCEECINDKDNWICLTVKIKKNNKKIFFFEGEKRVFRDKIIFLVVLIILQIDGKNNKLNIKKRITKTQNKIQ